MLEQKTPNNPSDFAVWNFVNNVDALVKMEGFPCEWDIDAGYSIEFYESCIDEDETLYLITWAPDPKELPNCDFITQHLYNVNFLAEYLKFCECGLFCVESTQAGNPHYHGWYQTSDYYVEELARCAIMKVMERLGIVKITKCKGHYRINSYTAGGNALHYYKADLFGQMQYIPHNPITWQSKDDTNWLSNDFFFLLNKTGRKTTADIETKICQRDYYREFYSGSLGKIPWNPN